MRRAALLSVLFLLAIPAEAGSSTDRDRGWPQWRGPEATGVGPHADPPVSWGENRNLRFKVELPGVGLSTPVVWADRIYLTATIRTDQAVDPDAVAAAEKELPDWRRESGISAAWVQRFVVLALDRSDGSVVWEKTVRTAAPHEGLHTDSTWASASIATDGELLIAQFGSNGTYALDLDGGLIWERDLGDMQTRKSFGEGSSPVIHGDRVVINWDHEGPSFVTVLDRRTGKTIWKADRDEVTSWSTPLIVEVGGKPQVVISATGRTRGYDLASGNVVWELPGMTVNAIPTPIPFGEIVLVTSGYRGNMLQAIDLAGARGEIEGTASVVWQFDQDTPYVPSPVLYEDQLYFVKDNKAILTAVDATSGAVRYGPVRLEDLDGVYASLVGAAGRVYVVGRNGATVVIHHGPEFEKLAVNRLDDHFDASPALVGDAIYLRGRKYLYCIADDPKAGQ